MDGLQLCDAQTLIRWLKEGPPGAIPITREQRSLGALQAVSWEDAGDREAIDRIQRWRSSGGCLLAAPAKANWPEARQWLVEQILEAPERVLFWIRDERGEAVGHVGLARFDFVGRTVAVRDVVCDASGGEWLVAEAVETLRLWVREAFGMWTIDGEHRLAAA